MAGLNRIWRIDTLSTSSQGAIGAALNTTIEFDEATVGTNQQYFKALRAEISVDISQTNALKGDINPSQDGGVGSVRLYINGVIKDGATKTMRERLIRWLLEDKTTTTFTQGRFGTVFVNYPEFNVQPLATADPVGYGWLIEDGEVSHDGEFKGKTVFSLTLKYNGNISGIVDNLGL